MRNQTGKKKLALLLCACLLLGLLPAAGAEAQTVPPGAGRDRTEGPTDAVYQLRPGAAVPAAAGQGTEPTEDCSDGLDLSFVTEDKTYTAGGGTAVWDHGARTLTLTDATIEGTSIGIYYDVNWTPLKVVVEGDCAVTGGILGSFGLTVEVGENASLTVDGDYAGLGVGLDAIGNVTGDPTTALAVTVAGGGSLTVTGGDGINNAVGSVSLSGGGLTLCAGRTFGVWGTTGVTVAEEVRGLAAGGRAGLSANSGAVTNSAAAFHAVEAELSPETLESLGPLGNLLSPETLGILADLLASGADLGTVEPKTGAEGLDLSEVTENATYLYPDGGVAHWDGAQKALSLTGVTIAAADAAGIALPTGSATVTADGICSVTGGAGSGSGNIAILGNGGLAVTVRPGASLTAVGGASTGTYRGGHGIYAAGDLALRVERGASLTAAGGGSREKTNVGSGAATNGALTLDNEGRVTARGLTGLGSEGTVTLRGSGVTLCAGMWGGIRAYRSSVEFVPGTVSVEGGRLICAGGIDTPGGTVELAPGAAGLLAGDVKGTLTDRSGGKVLVVPMAWFDQVPEIVEGDPDAALDLSGVAVPTLYAYDGGGVLWAPGDPAALAVSGDGLFLGGGVTFPEDTAVDVILSVGTGIGNGEGPAISAPGCALTLSTPCMDGNEQPSLHSSRAVALSAGSVSFTGGYFHVFGGAGAADVPVRVERGVGRVELSTEVGSAVPHGVTADPANVPARAGYHAELTTWGPEGNPVHLPGSPSNSAVSYSGAASNLTAAIAEGTVSEPTPPPPQDHGRDDDERYYAVLYKANYAAAPADVRDGGHAAGSKVTVKAAGTFAAPAGMAFSGWAETADGPVKYAPGDTFRMPSQTVTLYAVWQAAEPAGPGLNRTDHTAYLQGYPDGNVGPADLITREQTAAIFFRLLDADSRARYLSTVSPFPDVAEGRWSGEAVATMAGAGIILGLPDGSFGPERPITRAEFAAIAARFDSETYGGPDLFPDIAGHWAAALINRAAQKGWVQGGADGLFRPDDPITRAEAAALVNRVLERAPETAADLLPGMRSFPDNADPAAWYYLDLQEAANGHDYVRKADGVHETWTALAGGS